MDENPKSRPTLHLICNAHLDPVWQWRWEEGASEALATFRTAVEILRERPDFVFNHNEAVLYRWTERYDPALFEEIRALVAAGRWAIAGGWHLQPDANLPGLESLVRHMAEGRRWFRERFGVEPRVAYNFDSFGHSAGLPGLLARAGYRMYIHMRPQPHELELPGDLYRWRGPDGSEVLGYRIAVGLYHTERDNLEARLREGTELALRLGRDVPVFWGLGDHGGGPTREDLERIDAFRAGEGRVEVFHSTTERLLDALEEAGKRAPVIEGEVQRCFTGCYTSISRLKRRARESLGRIAGAEALCTAAWWARGAPYPAAEIEDAWRDHLFNDFHDILPGSCTASAEADALDLYGRASETARRARLGAAVALAAGPLRSPPLPVTVLSANPAVPRAPVEVECLLDYRPRLDGEWHLRLFDAEGTRVPCQEEQPESLLPFNGWRRKVSFLAELPGVGARVYRLEPFPGPAETAPSPPALPHRIDPIFGLVASLDAGGRECLAGPLLLPLVVRDEGDSWGTGFGSYRQDLGRFVLVAGPRQVEGGPVRTIVESVFAYGRSRIVLHTISWAAWPVLEFRLRIHWCEERKRLKLSIPAAFASPRLTVEVPGAAAGRPADGEERVQGRWLVIEGEAKGGIPAAIGVVNGGQHGLDFAGGEARLSVLRGAAYCHERGFKLHEGRAWRFMDQGVHETRLLVTTGESAAVRAAMPGLSDLLDTPPAAYAHLPAGTDAPAGRIEVLSLSPGHIRLTALKRSWDGAALVARIHEAAGVAAEAELRVAGLTEPIRLRFGPFELKTLRVERDGAWREVDLIREI
jgi:alpha-mannosidase